MPLSYVGIRDMLNVSATVLYTLNGHNYIRFLEQQNYGMPRKLISACFLFAITFLRQIH